MEKGLFEVWGQVRTEPQTHDSSLSTGGMRLSIRHRLTRRRMRCPCVRLGSVVNGRAVANQKNYYRFFACQGQRVVVSCYGEVIDSKLDPVIQLLDADGRMLQKDRQGWTLDYTALTTGPLFVIVSDLTYRGGEPFFYRLSMRTDLRMPTMYSRLSAPAGGEQEFHIFGRNLLRATKSRVASDFGALLDHAVSTSKVPEFGKAPVSLMGVRHSLPGFALRMSFLYSVLHRQGSWFQRRIGLCAFNSIVEMEAISGEAGIQKVDVPVVISGMFYPRLDQDAYEFDAKKGERYWIDVHSYRLGYGTSPLVVVEQIKEDGNANSVMEYLTISTYSSPIRMEAFPAPFEIEATDEPVELLLNERVEIPVKLQRRFGFDGQLEVRPTFTDQVKGLKATISMLRNDQITLTLGSTGDGSLARQVSN